MLYAMVVVAQSASRYVIGCLTDMQAWLMRAIGSASVHDTRHLGRHKVKWLEKHRHLQVNVDISASQNPGRVSSYLTASRVEGFAALATLRAVPLRSTDDAKTQATNALLSS
jgi:hypothetical protein